MKSFEDYLFQLDEVDHQFKFKDGDKVRLNVDVYNKTMKDNNCSARLSDKDGKQIGIVTHAGPMPVVKFGGRNANWHPKYLIKVD